ncbi:hypothetical protein I302_104016 [Kwoniella bestiolae CBS 10118]|uniref:Uncharacterized protein n=1 Tax=Kwoniella bestiolae CBS 10118 TaxID=1296100 RepID=A0A1B9GA30_9TREE|nr:hypothetical protein I302_02721 [Kwoniella bestiolae CBS 10118]OCF27871.1 hypothetical protein I302_02721 [Kwoniella bestiolae CBS 10118]
MSNQQDVPNCTCASLKTLDPKSYEQFSHYQFYHRPKALASRMLSSNHGPQMRFSNPTVTSKLYTVDMELDSSPSEGRTNTSLAARQGMTNLQRAIDRSNNTKCKAILADSQLRAHLERSVQSIALTLGMASSIEASDEIWMEYCAAGFKCIVNQSSEFSGNDNPHNTKFSLKVNVPEADKVSKSNGYHYDSIPEREVTDAIEASHDGPMEYDELKIGYRLPRPSSVSSRSVEPSKDTATNQAQDQPSGKTLIDKARRGEFFFSSVVSEALRDCLPTHGKEGTYLCFKLGGDLSGIIAPRHALDKVAGDPQWVLTMYKSRESPWDLPHAPPQVSN